MRTLVALLILSAPACLAQTISFPVFFPQQLKQYLGLSDDQVVRITAIKTQFSALQSGKIQRQAQLQSEIVIETAKPVPDPLALGSRYAEIESIRRELEIQQRSLLSQTQLVLGADQKIKLAALEQALSLYATACSAIDQNLLSPPSVSAQLSVTPVLLGIPSFGTCVGIPSLASRGAVFSPSPIAPQP